MWNAREKGGRCPSVNEGRSWYLAGLPESGLDIDELMRAWFMALEYVAGTIGGNDESERVSADVARVRDQLLEVERRGVPNGLRPLPNEEVARR
jgi:hypothetical protein